MCYYNSVNGGKGMKEKKYLIEIIQPLDMGDLTWYTIGTHLSTSSKKAVEEIIKLNPSLDFFDIRATKIK